MRLFLAGVAPGGGCFPPPSIAPLSLKLFISQFQAQPCPPRATTGDSHILGAPGVGFSLLRLARGVLNQRKSSIILRKKHANFALPLKNKCVAAHFICLYMLEVSSVT